MLVILLAHNYVRQRHRPGLYAKGRVAAANPVPDLRCGISFIQGSPNTGAGETLFTLH